MPTNPDHNPASTTTTAPARPEPPPARTTPPPPTRKRRRWIAWLVAVLIVIGLYFVFRKPHGEPAQQAQQRGAQNQGGGNPQSTGQGGRGGRGGRGGGALAVSAETVQKGNMGEYISALGTVTPVYTVTVASRVVGQLTEIHYKEGQIVHKGDLLAVIDPRPYQAVVTQAEGQLARDQALLENARIDLNRYQSAYQQHAIPEQQLATQQATVHQDEGAVKLDEGNLDAARVNVAYTRITSPIDGRVGLRTVDLGNIVPANGTTGIVTITQLQPITVIFTLAEDYIGDVVKQLRGGNKLRVDAISRDDQSEIAQGTLMTLDNQVDTSTGTVRARASFANRDYRLFPNEFVNARLLVRTLMGVNIVPNAALQRNGDQSFVYIVNADKSVQSRNVEVATSDGLNSAVTGVSPGETIVTDGFDKLQDGMKVVIRKPVNQNPKGTPPQLRQREHNKQTTGQGQAQQISGSSQSVQTGPKQ